MRCEIGAVCVVLFTISRKCESAASVRAPLLVRFSHKTKWSAHASNHALLLRALAPLPHLDLLPAQRNAQHEGMSEEAALRLRLQAKEVALRSLTKKYLAFANAIENSPLEECEATYDALTLEIKTYEFAVSKASSLVDTNVQQVAEYDAMQQDVEAMMCGTALQHRPAACCIHSFELVYHGWQEHDTRRH